MHLEGGPISTEGRERMDHPKALEALSSAVPSERLEAARFLQFWAVPADISVLRTRLQVEPVGWVRRAIEDALLRLGDAPEQHANLDDFTANKDGSVDESARARVKITRTVVHELSPIAAAIEYFAGAELNGYADSQTKKHVDRMIRFISAIDTLGGISSKAVPKEANLAVVVANCVEAQQIAFKIHIEVDGPSSVHAYTDPGLVELIISNGLKNACEAVIDPQVAVPVVTVLYGGNDREFWVNIIDNGVGMPIGGNEKLFDIGTSTKKGHLGMGLALCGEAADSLDAKIRLSSGDRGTKFAVVIPISGGERASSSS
ncbi:sensor histidine kinase [Saccharothrix texasensis]|uniref:histidine kinase n=1 Tax=Saccharothrix texasensis TaxID=103734 RepID=A0A3N1H875_9PSEU|nr:HAMP domain-containing sensor histidine kinase [Saccharothrix texasensis]ROP38641.1 signal transduction histidine kinase [Saccharothrix texasensis]